MADNPETKWDEVLEGLEAEGLPKEKAREVLPKAIAFTFEVDQKRREEYLSEDTLRTYRETFNRLAGIGKKYPGTKGLMAQLFLEKIKEEGELKTTVRVLQLCDRGVRLGIMLEWNYLGKEARKWRLAGTDTGETGIHPRVLNAGVHVYDFRSRNQAERKMRHFLPSEWRDGNQLTLTGYLANEVRKAEEAYRASRPKREAPATPEITPEATPEATPEPTTPTKAKKAAHKKAPMDEEKTPKPKAKARGSRRQQEAEDIAESIGEETA